MSNLQKYISIIFVVTAFMLLSISMPEPAAAADPGEVLFRVAKNNLHNLDNDGRVSPGSEPVPGGSFKFYEIIGDLGAGWAYFSIDEPVGGTSMQAVINFKTGQLDDDAIVNVVPMNGYELREVTYADYSWGLPNDEVEVWLVLPKYVIEVALYETGYDKATNLQKEKEFALQLMDGLEKAGLLGPAAPVSVPADSTPTTQAGAPAAGVTGKPLDEPVKVSDTMNIAGVYNGATVPTTFSVSSPHLVTFITTYHWNNARGVPGGTIALQGSDGKIYGPWQVSTRPGQGGVPNAYWEVEPNIVVPAGTYTVIDSDPATWSQNKQSGGKGMGEVRATPHFETTGGSVNDLKKGTSGSRKSSAAGGHTESPAGVGAVGNIPGPANTVEAVVGVAVPGLIATLLGTLAGLGGGGGGFTPPGGTPVSPAGGGSGPGAAGSAAGAGAQRLGTIREAGQLGRRRREPGPVSVSEVKIAPAEQDQGGASVSPGADPIAAAAGQGAVPVQPESTIVIDPAAAKGSVTGPGSTEAAGGVSIDTSALEDEILSGGETGAEEPGTAGDKTGIDKEGFDKDGFDAEGFDKEGYNQAGFDQEGFNREGFDQSGFNREGFDKNGFDRAGFDREGINKDGFDAEGFDKEGYNQAGFDQEGFNREGFDQSGFDREGFNKAGFDKDGFNKEGFNKDGFNKQGYDQEGFNKEGFDREGFNKDGFNKAGFDREGFNREGFDKNGFDREGYGRHGFDREGYNREGYDVNGYDRKGYNRSGYDARGYDRQGYDKAGFNKEGWDRDGYDRSGFNRDGFDRAGYDKAGYDQDGYDRDGFDRAGMEREGYDPDGYDQDGFNKNGVDKDGYDREGFNYEGYNRQGYDPWGYNKQGYGQDGYHWSGYNADGYDRSGKHWSENPFETKSSSGLGAPGSPFDVDTSGDGVRHVGGSTRSPFDGEKVIPHGVDPAKWKPEKPPLGEPYPKTAEKYGARPWDDQIPQPEPEKAAVSKPEDPGVIGPEDPMNTLEKHGLDKGAPAAGQEDAPIPATGTEGPESPAVPQDDWPVSGDTTSAEPGLPGWPRDGEKRILGGKTDGRSIEIEYNGKTGEWINTESGNIVDPDRFEQWQNDLAEDRRRAAEDIEKMSQRQDAHSKALDQAMEKAREQAVNQKDLARLEKISKIAEKHGFDVERDLQSIKKEVLAGQGLDQDGLKNRLEKITSVIDEKIREGQEKDLAQAKSMIKAADILQTSETIATVVLVTSDTLVDGLAHVTGPAGKAIRAGYKVSKGIAGSVAAAKKGEAASAALAGFLRGGADATADFVKLNKFKALVIVGGEVGGQVIQDGLSISSVSKGLLGGTVKSALRIGRGELGGKLGLSKYDEVSKKAINAKLKVVLQPAARLANKTLVRISGEKFVIEKLEGQVGLGAIRLGSGLLDEFVVKPTVNPIKKRL